MKADSFQSPINGALIAPAVPHPGVNAWARENATLDLEVLRTLSEGTSRPEPGGNDAGGSQQPIAEFITLSAARPESSFYTDGGHDWIGPAAGQIAPQPAWPPQIKADR